MIKSKYWVEIAILKLCRLAVIADIANGDNSQRFAMDKEDYYKKSSALKLPLRCPILNICQRRALTIYFFSYRDSKNPEWEQTLNKAGELSESYHQEKIEFQGESPTIYGGGANFMSFCHTCPEVPLFDNEHRPFFLTESPCTDGDWDNYRVNIPKFKNQQEKHYSGCAEFGLWNYSKKKPKRKAISSALRSKLQQEISSLCPFCFNKDVAHFDVHHIDEDIQNNNFNNLLMLCKICHSKITKNEILFDSVRKTKDALSMYP